MKCAKAFGYPASINENSVEVSFNDIFSEEQKAVLLKFEIKRPIDESIKFDVDFSYDDAVEVLDKVSISQSLAIETTTNKAAVEQNIHPITIQNIAYFEANALHNEAMLLVDNRNFDEAKKLVVLAISKIEATLSLYPDAVELKKQLGELKIYQSKLNEMKDYTRFEMQMAQKSSRMRSYASMKTLNDSLYSRQCFKISYPFLHRASPHCTLVSTNKAAYL